MEYSCYDQYTIKIALTLILVSFYNITESLIVYSLVVRGSRIGTKNSASLYVGIPMADEIGLKDGRPSVTILWTLAEPYIIPGLELEEVKSLYCSMEISFLSLRFLITSVN